MHVKEKISRCMGQGPQIHVKPINETLTNRKTSHSAKLGKILNKLLLGKMFLYYHPLPPKWPFLWSSKCVYP